MVIIIWFAFAVGCALLAQKKNRNTAGWFALGVLGGIFALGILLLLPMVDSSGNPISNQNYKKCRYCAEQILFEAQVCKHCGKDLN